jgi:hypothetical protein
MTTALPIIQSSSPVEPCSSGLLGLPVCEDRKKLWNSVSIHFGVAGGSNDSHFMVTGHHTVLTGPRNMDRADNGIAVARSRRLPWLFLL